MNRALDKPLSQSVLDHTIAMDEWRRAHSRPERIMVSGPLAVTLTTEHRLIATVGPLTLYDVLVPQRRLYVEARRAGLQLAREMIPRVRQRAALLENYYPGERPEVEAHARLYLMDWTTEIHALYDFIDPIERALPQGDERAVLASISQALANTIF